MTKQVQVKNENNLSTEVKNFDMGDFIEGGLTAQDLKIETIVLAQNNSKIINENKTMRGGDFYASVSRDKVVGDGVIHFIPLMVQPVVQVFENENGSTEWKEARKGEYIETVTRAEWGDKELLTKDYVAYEVKSLFLSLVGDDVITEIPYKLNFKSSNMQAFQPIVKKIIAMSKVEGFNQTHLVFKCGTKVTSKDNNQWYTFDVSFERESTKEERENVVAVMETLKALDKNKMFDDSSVESEGHTKTESKPTPSYADKEDLKNYAPES